VAPTRTCRLASKRIMNSVDDKHTYVGLCTVVRAGNKHAVAYIVYLRFWPPFIVSDRKSMLFLYLSLKVRQFGHHSSGVVRSASIP